MRLCLRIMLAVLITIAVVPLSLVATGTGPAFAASTITVNRATAAPGDSLYVTGAGYTPNTVITVSTQVYVKGAARTVTVYPRSNTAGKFAAALPIPANAAPGSYRITATDPQKDSASRHLAVWPAAVVSRYGTQPMTAPVSPGHWFYAKGSGFPTGHSVQITITFPLNGGGSTQLVRTPTVTTSGTFEIGIQVPQNAAHTLVKMAVDYAPSPKTGFHKTAYLNVVPFVVLTAGGSASSIEVTAPKPFYAQGSGFAPNENVQITVTFPLYNGTSVTVNKTVATDSTGHFNATLIRTPIDTKQTTLTLNAVGLTSKKQATGTASVVYRPTISLSSKTVRPGGTVTVNGYGYAPNSTVQFVLSTTNGTQTTSLNGSATTDANGHFSTTITVPSNFTPGTYTLTATGSITGAHASTTLKSALAPTVTLQPGTVSPGQTVKLTGQGFTPNVAVTISVTVPLYGGGSHLVTKTVGADAQGNFTTYVTIPGHAAASTVTVTAKGPNAKASAKLGINHIGAAVVVSPATAVPGSTITVRGSGYPANDTVDISIAIRMSDGSTRTLTATAHTGPKGGFVKQVAIPSDAAVGTYTVTARSETTGRAPTSRLTLSVHAGLSVQPGTVKPGGSITVFGGGFGAGATITVSATFPLYGGGSKTVTTTVHSNSQGNISARLPVPARAAAGPVSVTATGPNSRVHASFQVGHVGATISVSPSAVIPGGSVTVKGSGYLANSKIDISVTVGQSSGGNQTLTATATTNASGQFTATLHVPANVSGGTYTVTARSEASGRAPTAHLVVSKLAPSVVASPKTAVPGTQITINGFGFAAGQSVTIALNGQKLATATTNASGTFTTTATVPANTATGTYTITATAAGVAAHVSLAVNRQVTTHFYFASIYTGAGYQQLIDILNPTGIQARVTVTYMRTNGTTLTKTATVAPHSRYTENAATDLGVHVSASASVAADVPIVAERFATHGIDGTVVPGVSSPATSWYFATGNTSGKYRTYIALQNPNSAPVQVTLHLLPTHHRAFNIVRTLSPTSRLTIKVNKFVRDAVGVVVHSSAPIVANQTVFIKHGDASKIGVTAPHRTWYFAGGPATSTAHYWIGAINPNGSPSYVTLHAYAPDGSEVGTVSGWVKGFGRVGYLMNKIAHRTDVAVTMTASRPIVAEQTTYIGKKHNASTDSFGVVSPTKGWGFAASNTLGGMQDALSLFNPNLAPLPVVVQFYTSSGQTIQRTYVINPLGHQRIDVGSVVPNARLGITTTSNLPFVALNRQSINNGQGADTSHGIAI